MYRHILIPTDGTALSAQAAAAGIDLARALGARVTALYVIPTLDLELSARPDDDARARGARLRERFAEVSIRAVRDAAREAGVACEGVTVRAAQPHAEIISFARAKGCDLIVMASHGATGESGLLVGSETLKVLTLGDVPVLVHRVARVPAR